MNEIAFLTSSQEIKVKEKYIFPGNLPVEMTSPCYLFTLIKFLDYWFCSLDRKIVENEIS